MSCEKGKRKRRRKKRRDSFIYIDLLERHAHLNRRINASPLEYKEDKEDKSDCKTTLHEGEN